MVLSGILGQRISDLCNGNHITQKELDGEQLGEAVIAATFQTMRNALAEQEQTPLTVDDVITMIAGQIG